MPTYNLIRSTAANDLVTGIEGNDSISVYGNHTTVQANGGDDIISVNGGRHDNGMWVDGDESNIIYAGNGNDSIRVVSRGASVYGGNGNDTIDLAGSYFYAEGASGDDVFYRSSYDKAADNVTITTGVGADTLYFDQSNYRAQFKAVVTDFSNDDSIYLNQWVSSSNYYGGSGGGAFSYTIENGNVVISDNASISGDNIIVNAVAPQFTVTLQGVSSINEVANAKFYRYCNNTPLEITTLGELFGIDDSSAVDQPTGNDTRNGGNGTNQGNGGNGTSSTSGNGGNGTGTTYGGGGSDTNQGNGGNGTSSRSGNGGNGTGTTYGGGGSDTNQPYTPTIQSDANADAYVYSGGNVTLSATESYYSSVKGGYTTYDQVNFTTDLISFGVSGDKISINSSSGTLTLQGMRGKYMNYADGNGTPFAYSYIGVNGSSNVSSVANGYSTVNNTYNKIDNRARTTYGVVIGGDNLNDSIIAGSGGSSLWGGNGGNDTLVGGAGVDEFVYKLGNGNDVIQNASSSDFVNLEGIKLSQITSIDTSAGVSAKFSDGGSIRIEGTESVGIKVDGWTVAYNHSSGSWQVK